MRLILAQESARGHRGCAAVSSDALTPDGIYAEFRRAQDYLASGQPTAAARIVEPVVAAEPGNTAALELLARAYFESAQLARAVATLRRLVDAVPDDGWARFALARCLERTSRHDEAAEHRRVAEALGHRSS
jgi:Flp pilus assembly protein TadD